MANSEAACVDDDGDDCEFCAGREAFHRGAPREANPYEPVPGVEPRSSEWFDTPYGFWDEGWSAGSFDGRGRAITGEELETLRRKLGLSQD